MASSNRADKAFEYFLLIATLLQSILFQLFTYLLLPDEQKFAIAFAAIFFFPYLLALITWIYATLENLSTRTVCLRLIAWASTEAGLSLNLYVLFIFLSLKPITINVDLGTWVLLGAIVITLSLSTLSDKILKMYRGSTQHYNIWNPRYGRLEFSDGYIIHALVYLGVIIFLTLFLKVWTS